MAEEEVGLRLSLKNRREVQHGVHEVGDELDRTGDKAHRVGREARFGAAGLLTLGKSGKVAGRAVLYGTGAAAAGVVGLGVVTAKFTKDAVKGWEDHTKVVRQTRAVIKSTGGTANLTARQVGGLSDALERKTGVDGDVIQSGANMLLTFKNVRNEQGRGNKIFSQSLTVLNDMSAFMKTDASKSAVQLGKALNDPVKGVSALAKVGVTFDATQKKQIENYVKQNKMAAAQKIILRELTSEFGGAAKSQMTTGDQVMVGYHALQDTIGKAVIPLQQKFNRFLINDALPTAQRYADVFEKRGVPAIEKYAGIFERRGIPAIKDFYREGRPIVEDLLPQLGGYLQTTSDTVNILAPKLKSIFDSFNSLPDWAKEALVIGGAGASIAGKLGAGKILGSRNLGGSGILGAITKAKPLPVYVVNGGMPGVPGAPKGSKPTSWLKRAVPFAPALAGGQVAAGASIFAGGVASEYVLQKQLRAGVENSMRSRSSVVRGGGTALPDVVAGNQVGEALWRANLANDWPEVIRIAREYKDVLKGSATGQQQLQRASYRFTSTFGQDLQGVISRLDTADAKVNNLTTTLLGLPAIGSYGNGLGVLAPRTAPRRPKRPKKSGGTSFPTVEPVQPLGDDYFGRQAVGDTHVYIDGEEVGSRVERRWQNSQARG